MKTDYFIEWPEISFEEIKDYYVENNVARFMYKGIVVALFIPEIVIRSFYEVLRFKG